MTRWLLLLGVLGVLACGDKKPVSAGTGTEAPPTPAESVDVATVPQMGKIYSEAVRKAREETNPENARARLSEIERAIENEVSSGR